MKHWVIGRSRAIHIQFLRYFFVGGSSAVIDLLVFAILVKELGIWYPLAAFAGYMLGLTWNYILCLIWVFESKHSRLREIVTIIFIAVGGLVWTWIILYLLISLVHLDEVIAKMISQVIVLLWNFGMRKFYVFD